jgi:hypothetical protein
LPNNYRSRLWDKELDDPGCDCLLLVEIENLEKSSSVNNIYLAGELDEW